MKKRMILSLVLVGLLAFGVGMGTFAWFTSQATSENNVFETGTLVIDDPGALTANMTVDNIYPSWVSEEKTITVHNSGSLDFKYRMSVEALTDNILYDGDTPLQISVNGADFVDINQLAYVDLGEIAAGSDGTFTVQFKLPDEANNDYQDESATFTFVFDATQTGNTGWAQ
ncbi:TasA family protein [Caldisalinibacter kiritimatiensis]|uniref:Spore coat protein n=1 Tax=Caldisalinibacter kiritimatiensis TaxID=1304284 RepID=R1AYD4_9FIRM|nr:TasA family protein [Caldisalinibacter kiritimatiensis]EOD01702.1 spore coat protein [Caldisalinibacter kiritimatiensis]